MSTDENQWKSLSFIEILRELELSPVPTDITRWHEWAEAWKLEIPDCFFEALSLGAAQLLTEYSNSEEFELYPDPYSWEGYPMIPLLWENQGNFIFGLHLNGQAEPPVLISHTFQRLGQNSRQRIPTQWRPFSHHFNDFAFSRLFDFQYFLLTLEEDWDDCFSSSSPYSEAIRRALSQRFNIGPTTADTYGEDRTVRVERYYRSGQRLSVRFSPDEGEWWVFNAAREELFYSLKTEIEGIWEER